MTTPDTTRRSLYYYELTFNDFVKYEGVEHNYLECLRHVNKLVRDKDKSRYLTRENDTLFFGQLDFIPDKKYIKGRLFKVRNDIFPQLINMSSEDISDLVTDEEQGILETTHFLIDYRNRTKAQVALEYNHYGARITEFVKYLSHLGRETKRVKKVDAFPLVRDRLESITTRINRVSKFVVKVHRDNIDRIKETDEGLATTLHHAQKYANSDYVTLDMKIDYKEKVDTPIARGSIMTWVRKLISKPDEIENFEQFRVEAEDEENNNKLDVFDLIIDKEKSQIVAEKKANSRVIVSSNFFPKMITEYERKYL